MREVRSRAGWCSRVVIPTLCFSREHAATVGVVPLKHGGGTGGCPASHGQAGLVTSRAASRGWTCNNDRSRVFQQRFAARRSTARQSAPAYVCVRMRTRFLFVCLVKVTNNHVCFLVPVFFFLRSIGRKKIIRINGHTQGRKQQEEDADRLTKSFHALKDVDYIYVRSCGA